MKIDMNQAKILNEMNVFIDNKKSPIKAYLFKINDKDALSLVHIRAIEGVTGMNVEYIDRENLNIKTGLEEVQFLKDKTIVIDEGHGGQDAGAVDEIDKSKSDYIRTLEKDLNNKVGNKVINRLKKLRAKVIVTRPNDDTVSLYDRVRIANAEKADIFISIHFNAASESAHGIETFKYRNTKNPKTHKLADSIHNQLVQYTNLYNRGVKTSGFYVLKYTDMPAVLVELGFITNNEEEKIVNTDEFQEKCANAIVQGIINTL